LLKNDAVKEEGRRQKENSEVFCLFPFSLFLQAAFFSSLLIRESTNPPPTVPSKSANREA
jgi:hypothetical protein